MNIAIVLFNLVLGSTELVREADRVRRLMNTGKISDSGKIIRSLYKSHPEDANVRINYAKFLYACGEYDSLIDEFKNDADQIIRELVNKAGACLKKVMLDSIEALESLLKESKYSKNVLMSLIKKLLTRGMFDKAKSYSENLAAYYNEDHDVMKLYAHVNVLSPAYEKGIKVFKDIGLYNDVIKLEDIVRRYFKIPKNSPERFGELARLVDEISFAELEDSYNPSLYTYFKYNHVLYEYIRLGVEKRAKNLSKSAEELHRNRKYEETSYFYIMSLIIDGDKNARKAYEEADFKNRSLRQIVERELLSFENRKKRAHAEQESQQDKNRFKKGRSSYIGQGTNTVSDHLGYYELLGVEPDADGREIRRAFLKKTRENNYEKYKETDPQEYKRREEIQKKLNKANDVLKNVESREKYDKGMDSAQAHGSYHQDVRGFDDFFKMFFGGSNFGRSGNGGQGGHQSSGGTRYYYYYG